MSSTKEISRKDRVLGGLWGSLVGDALGVPVEFKTRAEVQANPVTHSVRLMRLIRATSSREIPSENKNSSCPSGARLSNSACQRPIALWSIPAARSISTQSFL